MKEFDRLVEIMARLRAPGGCPWDREQDHQSIKPYVIEEAYEVVQAIEDRDDRELRAELGDLLLQIVFHAQLASEEKRFDIAGVVAGINEKLIRRHPHVFSGKNGVDTPRQVLENWEGIKKEEGRKGTLDGVPRHLPALQRAWRITDKASRVGFDWNSLEEVFLKIEEEVRELEEVRQGGSQAQVEEEFGDLLFSLVNLSRFLQVEPEGALRGAIAKFTRRFGEVERRVAASGREMKALPLPELDKIWNEIKGEEKTKTS